MLIGGEENDFFERMMRGGETCWYVPDAVMWHIIPPGKLTEDYFRRLCYNVGVSQRLAGGHLPPLSKSRCAGMYEMGGYVVAFADDVPP